VGVVAGERRLAPAHHKLEQFSTNISKQRGIRDQGKTPSLPLGRPQNRSFDGAAYASRRRLLARRGTAEAGLKGKLGFHVFRAPGITACLDAGGKLENAQAMAAHESPATTKRALS
jgi:integrase/recombinase XerD